MDKCLKPRTVIKAEYFSEQDVDDPQEELCNTSSDLYTNINIFFFKFKQYKSNLRFL